MEAANVRAPSTTSGGCKSVPQEMVVSSGPAGSFSCPPVAVPPAPGFPPEPVGGVPPVAVSCSVPPEPGEFGAPPLDAPPVAPASPPTAGAAPEDELPPDAP